MRQTAKHFVASAVVALAGGAVYAQQDVPIPEGPTGYSAEPLNVADDVLFAFTAADAQEAAEAPHPEYWLGVQVAAVPELAKKQLGIERGLAVGDIVPDSPAAKADLRKFDILTKVNEEELDDLDDLVKAVEASQGKEMTVTILRSGKQQTAKVTAVKRPEGQRIDVKLARPEIAEEIRRVEEALQKLKAKTGDERLRFYVPRPGVVAPRAEVNRAWSAVFGEQVTKDFPSDLSVHVTKEGDQPAKIHVKRGEKEWDVTEDKLGELPDDIRPHVEKYVGKGLPLHFRPPAAGPFNHQERRLRLTPEGKVEGEIHIRPPMPPSPPATPVPPPRPRGPGEPAGGYSNRIVPGAPDARRLDAIHKELRELRKEVEELRKAGKE